jgi:hypothetical protein
MATFFEGVTMPTEDSKNEKRRMTRKKLDGLETWVAAYLRDVKTRGLSLGLPTSEAA